MSEFTRRIKQELGRPGLDADVDMIENCMLCEKNNMDILDEIQSICDKNANR